MMALQVVAGFRRTRPAEPSSTREGESDPQPASLPELLVGAWEFADFPWQLTQREVATSQLDSALSDTTGLLRSAAVDREEPLSDEPSDRPRGSHRAVLEFLEQLGASVKRDGPFAVFRQSQGPFRITAVAFPAEAPSELAVIRLAAPRSGDRWRLLEAKPSFPAGEASLPGKPSLASSPLPLPAAARIVATRRLGDGSTFGHLAVWTGNVATLTSAWDVQEWPLQPVVLTADGGGHFICRRAEVACYLWVHPLENQEQSLVFVARSPEE